MDRSRVLGEEGSRIAIHLAFFALDLLILLEMWVFWRRPDAAAILVGNFVLTTVVNAWGIDWLRGRYGVEAGEAVRVVWNLGATLIVGHLTGWGVAVDAYLLLQVVVMAMLPTPTTLWRTGVLWGGTGIAAVLDGGSPTGLLMMGAGVAAAFFVVRHQSRVIARMLEEALAGRAEVDRARRELTSIHDAAVRQEKLAALGMLAAGIAHEINNPMSFVGSNVSSLQRELKAMSDLPDSLREWADEIIPETLDGIRRVNAIVADLRRFARNDRAEMEPFDLNEEVEAALRIAGIRIKCGCTLVRDLGELPQILGRPRQISQLLLNLVVNAAQATHGRAGGTVTVTTRSEERSVRVSVHDNGMGMDEATRARLFEPFFTTKPVGEGTGLGLAVVHGVVTDHGGRIEVESAPGQGSCFTVWLPREAPHVPPPERQPTGTWRLDAIRMQRHAASG